MRLHRLHALLLFLCITFASLVSFQSVTTAAPLPLAPVVSFQNPTPSTTSTVSHCWVESADVAPVDDPNTPEDETAYTAPNGVTTKHSGKKGDKSISVKYCNGCETHAAHTDVDANGNGNNCNVTTTGNNATANVNGGTGPKAGSRINATGGSNNTVNTKGDKNCGTVGGSNTIHNGNGNGNHTHGPGGPQPPPY